MNCRTAIAIAAICLMSAACAPLGPAMPASASGASDVPPTAATTTATGGPAPSDQSASNAAEKPVVFEQSIARAGTRLMRSAQARLGSEPRVLVIDPLLDANTGGQTNSTVAMGEQLAAIVTANAPQVTVQPLTRETLASKPLLLIGTLTPVNTVRSIDTVPDAFRVWLTVIDLRTGRVVAKWLDRATPNTVDATPLPYYRDSPTWHKDKAVLGYINSCQRDTSIGDPADPDYLARLPAAAVLNDAIAAYGEGRMAEANQLYREAAPLADAGDLRLLNGLYLTSWKLGKRNEAREAFEKLVASGLELERLPMKLLFKPGTTNFIEAGDLSDQYAIWMKALAEQTQQAGACVRIVGHTSRTGSARVNERLSRQRAETIKRMLERSNRALATRLSAEGVGSRQALIGLGTDDQRDALDRRVEFRVVGCV